MIQKARAQTVKDIMLPTKIGHKEEERRHGISSVYKSMILLTSKQTELLYFTE